MTGVRGYRWQDVLGHRVEVGDPPGGAAGAPGTWNLSRWSEGTWGAGWAPVFHDVTADVLHVHSATGALGLDLAAGVGSLELELYDPEGRYSPEGGVDWLLGRHVRLWVTPEGAPEVPVFYGLVDHAAGGGTFAVPTVQVTAYDVRAVIGAAATIDPVGGTAQTAEVRLHAILAAANIPEAQALLELDPTPLLADDTLELGDLFGRTIESAAGLAWADGYGRIVTRNRHWINATDDHLALYVYAGDPPDPVAGVPVAQTVGDLDATQGLQTVTNFVTYANRAEPVESVTVQDAESIGRYGLQRHQVTDLASPLDLLTTLAARALALRKDPVDVCEGATVTVYDQATAQAAALALGQMVALGRNDPGVAVWEILGVVAGLELTIAPDRFDVGVSVLAAGAVAGALAVWDGTEALWDYGRWSDYVRPTPTTHWRLGPHAADRLDAGNVMG